MEKSTCPICHELVTVNSLTPNKYVNDLVKKYCSKGRGGKRVCRSFDSPLDSGRSSSDDESPFDQGRPSAVRLFNAIEKDLSNLLTTEALISLLKRRQQELHLKTVSLEFESMKLFLRRFIEEKQMESKRASDDAEIASRDLARICELSAAAVNSVSEQQLPTEWTPTPDSTLLDGVAPAPSVQLTPGCDSILLQQPHGTRVVPENTTGVAGTRQFVKSEEEELPTSENLPLPPSQLSVNRRQKLLAHYPQLERAYVQMRIKHEVLTTEEEQEERLNEFRKCLAEFDRYRSIRPVANISYDSRTSGNHNIVSSVEFDRDWEYFAVAGVAKRIKVYDFDTVLSDPCDVHYPNCDLNASAKVSCLSWNQGRKEQLAAASYEGPIQIWDVSAQQVVRTLHEHQKRCWSCAYNPGQPEYMLSGGDDARVKLWSMNDPHSALHTIEAHSNVCCVLFNPFSPCQFAFGAADQKVHCYDMRKLTQPMFELQGHSKAVSYIRFLAPDRLASASTDSTIRVWVLNNANGGGTCERVLTGHVNGKNFVGMATDGVFIVSGSEDNTVYLYHNGLTEPLMSSPFTTTAGMIEERRERDGSQFISSLCWKKVLEFQR